MSESILLEIDRSSRIDEDAALVVAAQQNPAEFKLLYTKWLKRVYRYFYFRVGNVKDAEDLTSQVFIKVYEDLPRYRNRGCFSAWLFTIAHARAVDFYRRRPKETPLEELDKPAEASDPLAQAIRSDETRQVLRLMRALSGDEQELIRLRFFAELSYREIGEMQNRKEDAVRKSITRLLDRLQSQLEVQND